MSIAFETEQTQTYELSKDDITALRKAHDVHARRSDGASQLETVFRFRNDDSVFQERSGEGRRVVPTKDDLRIYNRLSVVRKDDLECFAHCVGGQYKHHWATIVGLLREGDEIELCWIGNDSNGYMKAARGEYGDHGDSFVGLYHDRLDLNVYRKGKLRYSFHLDDCVCPNNTARMIRGV